jgi:hypothetical protein
MTSGERDRLVEKEKLGPAPAAHHVPLPPLVVEDANQPRFGRPAFPEQRLGRQVRDDAAIAGEKPRCGIAMTSPNGVTRFCKGLLSPLITSLLTVGEVR